jgi:hypothetical protein
LELASQIVHKPHVQQNGTDISHLQVSLERIEQLSTLTHSIEVIQYTQAVSNAEFDAPETICNIDKTMKHI